MPVRKFRSVEEMNRPHWRQPGTAELYRAIERIWTFGLRTRKTRFPPGVYRHRSIEEMNAQQESWRRED